MVVNVEMGTVTSCSALFYLRRADQRCVPEAIALGDFLKSLRGRAGRVLQEGYMRGKLQFEWSDEHHPVDLYWGHARALADGGIEWRIAARRSKGYTMIATYLYRGPSPATAHEWLCYCLRFEPLRSSETPDEMLRRLVTTEAERWAKIGTRPTRPELTVHQLASKSWYFETGDGSVTLHYDCLTGGRVFHNSPTRSLEPHELHGARLMARVAQLGLGPRPGRQAKITRGGAVTLFQELMPACADLLDALAGRQWPPYRHESNARVFVGRYENEPNRVRALASLLTHGRRRPSPQKLARRAVAKVLDLSAARVRQLLRK